MKIEKNSQILILVVVVIAVYLLLITPKQEQELSKTSIIISSYDADGNLLGQTSLEREGTGFFSRGGLQAVYDLDTAIQLEPDAKSVEYNVTVENTGNVPITASYESGILELP